MTVINQKVGSPVMDAPADVGIALVKIVNGLLCVQMPTIDSRKNQTFADLRSLCNEAAQNEDVLGCILATESSDLLKSHVKFEDNLMQDMGDEEIAFCKGMDGDIGAQEQLYSHQRQSLELMTQAHKAVRLPIFDDCAELSEYFQLYDELIAKLPAVPHQSGNTLIEYVNVYVAQLNLLVAPFRISPDLVLPFLETRSKKYDILVQTISDIESKLVSEGFAAADITVERFQNPEIDEESDGLDLRSHRRSKLATKPAPGVLPSKGSCDHHSGNCNPCAHAHGPKGCSNGVDCEFCHCFHEPKEFLFKKIANKSIKSRRESLQN